MKTYGYVVTGLSFLALASCAPQDQEGDTLAASMIEEIPISTGSDEALALYNEAQALQDAGRGIEANKTFRRAVEADPGFARGYLGVANNALSTPEFSEFIETALERSSAASEGEKLLIQINKAFLENNLEGALAMATELVEKYPNSQRALLNLGGAYSALNRNEESRAQYTKAIGLDPSLAAAHTALGFDYLFSEPKNFKAATEHFTHSVEITPDEPQAHVNLGDAYRADQDLEGAAAEYARGAELDPDNSKAVFSIALLKKGHVDSFLGNYDEARADYDRALAVTKPEQTSFYSNYRAFVSVHEDDPAAAIRELEEIVAVADQITPEGQVNGARIFALTNMTMIAMHHGMFDVAEDALGRRGELVMANARKTANEDFIRTQQAQLAYWDGILAARMGDFATARSQAAENARLLELDANPTKLQPYHDLLGLTALLEGDAANAIEHYGQANPNNTYTTYHLGLALDGVGRIDEAQEIFEKVFQNNFNSVGYALVRREANAKLMRTVS